MQKFLHLILITVVLGLPYCFCGSAHGATEVAGAQPHACCDTQKKEPPAGEPCAHCSGFEIQGPLSPPPDAALPEEQPGLLPFLCKDLNNPPGIFFTDSPYGSHFHPSCSLFKRNSVYRI